MTECIKELCQLAKEHNAKIGITIGTFRTSTIEIEFHVTIGGRHGGLVYKEWNLEDFDKYKVDGVKLELEELIHRLKEGDYIRS